MPILRIKCPFKSKICLKLLTINIIPSFQFDTTTRHYFKSMDIIIIQMIITGALIGQDGTQFSVLLQPSVLNLLQCPFLLSSHIHPLILLYLLYFFVLLPFSFSLCHSFHFNNIDKWHENIFYHNFFFLATCSSHNISYFCLVGSFKLLYVLYRNSNIQLMQLSG